MDLSPAPTDESDGRQPRAVSRRATLASGTAAGVLAWTTPVVLSSNANAATTCTPSCQPAGNASTTLSVRVRRMSSTEWFFYAVETSASEVCPCSAGSSSPSAPEVSVTGGTFQGASSPFGLCILPSWTTLTGTPATRTIDGTDRVGVVVNYSGYTCGARATLTIQLTCRDRTNRPWSKSCTTSRSEFSATGMASGSTNTLSGSFAWSCANAWVCG